MTTKVVLLALLVWPLNTFGQEPESLAQKPSVLVLFANNQQLNSMTRADSQTPCGLPFDSSFTPPDAAAALLGSIVHKLDQAKQSLNMAEPVIIAPISGNVVNAWTLTNIGPNHAAFICLPSAMRQITNDAPEELAAVLAHEMGHAADRDCWNYKNRTLAGRRSCEQRADSIGFAIMIRAGYNPFAFAGFFGRVEMYSGQTDTGFLSRLANIIASDHPITPDRIEHLHQMLVAQLQGTFIQPDNRIAVPAAQP